MTKPRLRLAAIFVAAASLAACSSGQSVTTSSSTSSTSAAPAVTETQTAAAGDAVKPKDGKVLKIGVSFPILDQFLQKVADGMTARAKENGVELNIVAAQEKTDVQLGQVENFIADKVDAILVVPVDTDAAGPMTKAAQDAKIPLVYVNRRPSDLPDTVPYVGSDSLVSGTLEMEALAKLAGGKGNVAIIQGDPANEAAVLRTKGCKDVVAKNPGMKVVKEQAGNWQRDKGLAIMENWIQSGEQIDVVCANNDEMALGAIQALKAANKLDKTLVGGVDATGDALTAMAAKELAVTVFQDAKGQGAGGVDAAVKLYNGETVPGYVDVPYQLVTPENMADFAGK
ncbi:sugar ABC transporter substrate-binding protein [Kineosporia sp. R_H_3]|uniref:sugar ABC transporter substrate-binding protein n=1 Tax=Kineosporia sp. R_H_3 TaxID=1961848 RepID=UPI000B4B0EBA|nr:sugar ABC transporter substrate-binding protein [Kineosporia sp. R_H_3]